MAPAAATVQVEYAAEVGCPDRSAFVQALFSRVPRASEAGANAEVRLHVSLARGGSSSLVIELPEGSSRREIFAACQDAVDSMLVIAAMVVDAEPGARLAAADVVPTPQAPVDAAPHEGPPPSPAALQPSVARPPLGDRPTTPNPTTPAASWSGSLGLGASLESAVRNFQAPGVVAGFAFAARSGAFRPAGALELLATPPSTAHVNSAAVKLSWLAARASACARAELSVAWHFSPCATFDTGVLFAKGQDVEEPESHSMPWLAPGAALRLDCDLSERWGIEAVVGGRGLLRHDLFYFRPKQTAYSVAPYSLGAGINLRARIF